MYADSGPVGSSMVIIARIRIYNTAPYCKMTKRVLRYLAVEERMHTKNMKKGKV